MDLLKKRDLLFINKIGPYILYIRHTSIIIILKKTYKHKHGLWTVIIYLPTNNFFSKTHFFVYLNISLLVVSSPTRWIFPFSKPFLFARTHQWNSIVGFFLSFVQEQRIGKKTRSDRSTDRTTMKIMKTEVVYLMMAGHVGCLPQVFSEDS
jgi:hypothetical protein